MVADWPFQIFEGCPPGPTDRSSHPFDGHAKNGQSATKKAGPLRIWDVPPSLLCRQHLLGEHRELHGLWNILVLGKTGYSRHPETRRWEGKLAALFARHEALVAEMTRRGFRHNSPLDPAAATGDRRQDLFIDSPERQLDILRAKPCSCLELPAATD